MKSTRRIIIHTFILRLSLKVSTLKCIPFPGFPSHPNIRRTWRSGQKVGFGMNVTSQERTMVKLSVEPDLMRVQVGCDLHCTSLPRTAFTHSQTGGADINLSSATYAPRVPAPGLASASNFSNICVHSRIPMSELHFHLTPLLTCCTGCVPTASRRMSSGCLEIEHSLGSGSIIRFSAVTVLKLNEEMPLSFRLR